MPANANQTNLPGVMNKYRQALYDYSAYAAAGVATQTFFQTPQGQNNRTFSDTNMQGAGSLPAPQKYIVDGIEVVFTPGVKPSAFGAESAALYANDVWTFYTSQAHLEFWIGNAVYAWDSPLINFAPRRWFDGFGAAADASTAGANLQTTASMLSARGEPFKVDPQTIVANQNFRVVITWDAGAVALPSTVAGRYGVRLNGTLYRAVQ